MFAELAEDDALIPEMERLSEKELKEIDLSDWPDDPSKLLQDNSEDISEEDSEDT
jgi:hypothetical protein